MTSIEGLAVSAPESLLKNLLANHLAEGTLVEGVMTFDSLRRRCPVITRREGLTLKP
jgi:hypothetical protein